MEVTPVSERDIVVCVRDDGVGLPQNFEVTQAATLGLRLVANLAGQLRGRLTLGDGSRPRAVFRVAFPLPAQERPEEQL